MASPKEKLQIDPSSMTTLNNIYATSDDIEMQTPRSGTQLFYDEKHASVAAFPPPSLPFVEPSVAPRYNDKRWRKTWDKMVARGRWPRIIYGTVFCTLILCWVGVMSGVMVGFMASENQYEHVIGKPSTQIRSRKPQPGNKDDSDVIASYWLKGNLVDFDPNSRTLTVTWSGLYQNTTDPKHELIPMGDETVWDSFWPGGLGIYRDVSSNVQQFPAPYLNGSYHNIPSNWTDQEKPYPGWQWMYAVDNATARSVAVIGEHTWDSFDTDISFGQADMSTWRQPLFGYPFDVWQGTITFAASNLALATADNVTYGDVIELSGAILGDSTLNWRFGLEFNDTCQSDTTPDPNNYTSFNHSCRLDLTLTARRPGLVKFAAVMAVIVNWLATVFVFILTAESIIMRRAYAPQGTELLSVCFTALFALPTVRSLLPGAPGFGTINLVGIIPNILVLVISTFMVAVAKLYMSLDRDRTRGEMLEKED